MLMLAAPVFAETSTSTATRLTIEIRRAPGLPPERYTLACEPPTGTVPDPAGTCRRLTTSSFDVRVRWLYGSMEFCQPVYGGPEVMTVRGLLWGLRVDRRLTREDPCAMSAYDALERVFGVPGPAPGDEDAATL
jgi:hypothetical protein